MIRVLLNEFLFIFYHGLIVSITIPIHSHKKLNSSRFTDTEMGAAFTDSHTLIDSNKISMETKTAISYCIKIYYLLYSSINSLSIFTLKYGMKNLTFPLYSIIPKRYKGTDPRY